MLADEVYWKAFTIFGSHKKALMWLVKSSNDLDGKAPVELLSSPQDLEKVEVLLGRIEHGVIA